MCNIPKCVYYPCKELSADDPSWANACQLHLEWAIETHPERFPELSE